MLERGNTFSEMTSFLEKERTVDEWRELFPGIPQEAISNIIEEFTGATVRQYVDILIEKRLSKWQPAEEMR